MNKICLILSIALAVLISTMQITYAGGIGSEVKKPNLTRMRVGAYNTQSNISVIEYDTYGSESGYYIEDGFGYTTKYDKNGNILSKYKSGQAGRTYLYDKYNHVIGYFQATSKYRTMLYDKEGNALGYFKVDSDGLIKKYDMDGNHLNTYKNFKGK